MSACGICGKDPAEGMAMIDDVRFCHDGPTPTCYEAASWSLDLASDPEWQAQVRSTEPKVEASLADLRAMFGVT